MKLNARQLRKGIGNRSSALRLRLEEVQGIVKRNEIYIILDNVLDTYNIGSIFRLADAVAAKKIYICGESEIPPNHRIKKASINTTEWVEWEYAESALEAVRNVQCTMKNVQIVAIEQSKKSVQYDKLSYELPLCLVVGHETKGVSKEVLDVADAIVEMPMFGVNISLNVVVSLAIVLYKVIEKTA